MPISFLPAIPVRPGFSRYTEANPLAFVERLADLEVFEGRAAGDRQLRLPIVIPCVDRRLQIVPVRAFRFPPILGTFSPP